jgi:photoactive yellow protein
MSGAPTPDGMIVADADADAAADASAVPPGFAAPDLFDWLEAASADDLDLLAFGLIAMTGDGAVARYNVAEGKLSGLTPERVIGRNFFTSVAPCTNNFMVAHRFESEPEIDAVTDYVFTFRLAPLKVRLRLLKRPGAQYMYLAVELRD